MAPASASRSFWSNLAAGRYGNSLVNLPPITTSRRSAFLRSHHAPCLSNGADGEGADDWGTAESASCSAESTAGPALVCFQAPLSGLEPAREPRGRRASSSVSLSSFVIQTSAARAPTVMGNPFTNLFGRTADIDATVS